MVGVLTIAVGARADSIKIGGFWIDTVQIQDVAEGRMIYLSAVGLEVTKPLDQIEGVKVDGLPELADAEASFESGQYEAALEAYGRVRGHERWLRQWVWQRRVTAADRAGQPVAAVEAYLRLVQDDAEAFYLSRPPHRSVVTADAQQKNKIVAQIDRMTKRLADDHRAIKPLSKLLDWAGAAGGDAEAAAASPIPTRGGPDQSTAIPLPSAMPRDGHVPKLLRAGKYPQALDRATAALGRSGQLSMKLYQCGIAQLSLAEQTGDMTRYKDAGISFMRVVIYFPRSATYVGPALMEAGYVHQKIGRPDKARQLYERAERAIDPETEPRLAERLGRLIAALDQHDE